MRGLRSAAGAGAAVLIALVAASAASAESIKVSNTKTTTVKASTVLDAGHRYRLSVSGTVSDWCNATNCPPGDPATTPQKNVGVDGVWCYAKWRCPTPEAWQQLNLNGKGILDFAGLTPDEVPYSQSHRYAVEFDGISGPLRLGSSDALAGSIGDNSGSFTVTLTDLGPTAKGSSSENGAGSAPVRSLQEKLRRLGFYSGPLDGKSSQRLTNSVKGFEQSVGLAVDGKCDIRCEAALRNALGPLPAAEPTSTSAITKLQADLRMLGFYNGPLDGKDDPRVTTAIKDFEHSVGLPADGKCDESCVAAVKKALGLDDPVLPAGAAPTSAPTLTQLQADLSKLGFYNGPLDGKNGQTVDAAVKAFEQSAGLPADGKCGERCQLAIVKALSGR